MKGNKSSFCPNCQKRFKDIEINFDNPKIRCTTCGAEFGLSEVFHDSHVLYLAELIPLEQRNKFLTNLGFEQKPIVRTPKILLIPFVSFLAFGIAALITLRFLAKKDWLGLLSSLIGGGMLIWFIIKTYKKEKKPKWRRKNQGA